MVNLKLVYREWKDRRREARKVELEQRYQRESNTNVNVVEYNGALYFAFNGVPLVRVDDLKKDVIKILPEARATVITWSKTNKRDVWSIER